MATWSRATALLSMTSPLGGDVLIPTALAAHEAISQPFAFEVQAVSQHGVIEADTLLYQPACVTLHGQGGAVVRYFHGIVQSVSAEGTIRGETGAGSYERYRLVLVPRLWFLGQTVDCRVHQKLSVVDILQKMFSEVNLTDVSLPPPGATRDYTVQFNESDLHFATRLMEGFPSSFSNRAARRCSAMS